MRQDRHPLISGATVTSLGTLASRILGMVRDMATAAVLGMSGGGVMDAFVIAFRIPNLFRRLFGEGALAASYLPVVSKELERDRQAAWRLASVTFTWLGILLLALVVLAEVLCGIAWYAWQDLPNARLLIGLTATMLPYVFFVCLAAQLAATLHALGHFAVPALVPALLNISWLIAVLVVAPCLTSDRQTQVYVLAVAVVVAGPLQVGVQLPVLRRFGFRFDYHVAASRHGLREITRAMGPMVLGLMITQINTLADSLIAWSLSAAPDAPDRISWLPGEIRYPMQQGAAAAIYYGERLYQFPLGILGMAVATAIFPLLSRHAARGDRRKLAEDLTLGLRFVVFLAVPAGVGLMILAEPLARLLFERGRFTSEDTMRTARMIACYSSGVWAFCAIPVIVRGYYALFDRSTPARIGIGVVALNFALNLVLVWPLAEAGLAVATVCAAALQVLILAVVFSRRNGPLGWSALAATSGRTVAATCVMGVIAYLVLGWIPPADSLKTQLVRVLAPFAAAVTVYLVTHAALGGREVRLLLGGLGGGKEAGQGAFSDHDDS